MRKTKYQYGSVTSVTKLNDRHEKMLKWWSEFFDMLGDKLVAVDNTYAVIKTETRELQMPRIVSSNLLGSSRQVVEIILKTLSNEYQVIISSVDSEVVALKDAKESARSKYKYYNEYMIAKEYIDEIKPTDLELIGAKEIVYKVSKFDVPVTYYVYDVKNEIKGILFGSTNLLANKLKHLKQFKLKCFKDKFIANDFDSIRTMKTVYDKYRDEECEFLSKETAKLQEALIEFLNSQPDCNVKYDILIKEKIKK